MIFLKISSDKMKNMIEFQKKSFMEPILLKGLHRYFPPDRELFWDVKLKIWDFGKTKTQKQKRARLLQQGYKYYINK